jgi:hypothetical protein
MGNETKPDEEKKVYYFKCEGCSSGVFWSDIRPSVERAARVFKWVRAGCPNPECDRYLILSAPDEVHGWDEARRLFTEKQARGEKVYWI